MDGQALLPHLWEAPGTLGMASLTLGQVHYAHAES